ncbi:MAG: HAMP domain-containing histidine kinase [Melioribacteraceae bacterium]|nr:HAMP domain-containing histidine kinase [Melioribacteraceae bacterium]
MHLTKSNYSSESSRVLHQIPISLNSSNGIEASEDNKAFLSIISHNLKNPFGALLGYSELLLEDYSELSELERISYISDVKRTANLTYRYLERFFEWTYFKTNKIKLEFEYLNLRKLIAEATKSALSDNDYLGEINFNIPADFRVFADYGSMKKCFFYLLENSLKYSKDEGQITINAKNENGYSIIEIIDNGIGISKKRIENLFDITKNIAQNNEGPKNGSGLGLILTKQIIILNKGSINLESELNLGTKVVIKLPSMNNYF